MGQTPLPPVNPWHCPNRLRRYESCECGPRLPAVTYHSFSPALSASFSSYTAGALSERPRPAAPPERPRPRRQQLAWRLLRWIAR